jgi:predicted ester cyclase
MDVSDLFAARGALVLAHVAAENDHDLDGVLATFKHPRYEIVPTGVVHDGETAVRKLLTQQWEQLPELRYEAAAVFHGPDGVVVETRTLGTAPDGRRVNMLSMNLFAFEGADLVVERCYFDRLTVAQALGYGDAVQPSRGTER